MKLTIEVPDFWAKEGEQFLLLMRKDLERWAQFVYPEPLLCRLRPDPNKPGTFRQEWL